MLLVGWVLGLVVVWLLGLRLGCCFLRLRLSCCVCALCFWVVLGSWLLLGLLMVDCFEVIFVNVMIVLVLCVCLWLDGWAGLDSVCGVGWFILGFVDLFRGLLWVGGYGCLCVV